jgi:hypothetical protein
MFKTSTKAGIQLGARPVYAGRPEGPHDGEHFARVDGLRRADLVVGILGCAKTVIICLTAKLDSFDIDVPGPALGELNGQCDRRPGERLADRAVFLGFLGRRGETLLVQAGHLALDREVNASDALTRLESDLGLGLQPGRRHACPRQSVG